MRPLGALILSFIKVGCIGFGGGSALIPVIEAEAISNKGYISLDQYNDLVITANITPGALPVKLAAGIGSQVAGSIGMCAAATAVSLPAVAATLLLLSLILALPAGFLLGVENAAAGISIFIIFLLINYIRRVQREQRQAGQGRASLLIILASFVLTGGGELRSICALPGPPLFDISTTDLLLLAFFLIFLSCAVSKRRLLAIGLPLSLLFLLACGKTPLLPSELRLGLRLLMLLSAFYCFRRSLRSEHAAGLTQPDALRRQLLAWSGYLLLLSLPALLLCPGSFAYIGRGILSTLCSFGGGEAYLTVAEGFFVSSGTISSQTFYSQLVPIANALPGPILCKVLSGIGYLSAQTSGPNVSAWLIALAGYAASVSASCAGFFLVDHLYRKYRRLSVFIAIKQWILPLICGLLLSTMTAMINENLLIAAARGWSIGAALALMALIYAAIYLLHRFLRLHDLLLIILAALISLGAYQLLPL